MAIGMRVTARALPVASAVDSPPEENVNSRA